MSVKTSFGFGGFVIGFLSGGALIYFLANKALKNRVKELELQNDDLVSENQRLNAQKREMKKQKEVEDRITEEKKKNETKIKKIPIENSEQKIRDARDPRPGSGSGLNVKVNYAKLSQEYRSDSFDEHFADRIGPEDDDENEDEEEVEDEDEEEVEDEDAEEKTIRMISSEDFKNDFEYRDNETLTYYQLDDVLVDAANRKIDNEESVIGKECMGIISSMPRPEGTEDDDDDVDVESFVYVDNEFEDKIYEIIVNHNQNFYKDFAGEYY